MLQRAIPALFFFSLCAIAAGCGSDDNGTGPILFSGENNRLNAYAISADYQKHTVVPSAAGGGRDINGQICFVPDGSRRFIAGEDTNQPNPPAGWGFFQLMGSTFDDLTANQIGKLTPTYVSDDPENYGCGFLSDGRLLTTDVGSQVSGPGNGQLILWFPPFDGNNHTYCKLDIAIATAGGIAIDSQDRIYVASARSGNEDPPGIFRYTGPFPTSNNAAGGCGRTDETGAPLVTAINKSVFLTIDGNILSPNAIVASGHGTWYVSSILNGVIAEYSASGQFIRRVLEPPVGESLPFSTGNPLGLAVDSKGILYFADLGLTEDLSPGRDLGTVRRIPFDNHDDPLPPVIIDEDLNFPDGLGILE